MSDLDTRERPLIAAVDFDGTISEYDQWRGVGVYGQPMPGAVLGVQILKGLGFSVIVWTCRDEDVSVGEYCATHSIPIDVVNKNIVEVDWSSPKVYADVYIDDRGSGWRGWLHTIDYIITKWELFDRVSQDPDLMKKWWELGELDG